jgi:ATP-dependent DNA helicase PIF1
MLDDVFFGKLETLARLIRGNKRSFGGIQLILVGDFCQLPPIKGKNCFKALAWNYCIDKNINLTQVQRQKDD